MLDEKYLIIKQGVNIDVFMFACLPWIGFASVV